MLEGEYLGFSLSVCLSVCPDYLVHTTLPWTLWWFLWNFETRWFSSIICSVWWFLFHFNLDDDLEAKQVAGQASWVNGPFLICTSTYSYPSLSHPCNPISPILLYFFTPILYCIAPTRSYHFPVSACLVSHSSNLPPLLFSPSLLVPVIFPST